MWLLLIPALLSLIYGSALLGVAWAEEEGAREWALILFWPLTLLVVTTLVGLAAFVRGRFPSLKWSAAALVSLLVIPYVADIVGLGIAGIVIFLIVLDYGIAYLCWERIVNDPVADVA